MSDGGNLGAHCQDHVLNAAKTVVLRKGVNEFTIEEIIEELRNSGSTYKESTIRTHVSSRCCVNAPEHHAVRYAFFERTGRGLYRIVPNRTTAFQKRNQSE